MPTIGFSAYLKLVCLNDRPRGTALRQRLQPKEDAYDFHRSLRLAAKRLLVDGHPEAEVVAELARIPKEPERHSATSGIKSLANWRRQNAGEIVLLKPAIVASPSGLFSVKYEPTFGIKVRDGVVAIHLWNTKAPKLDRRSVYGALTLVPGAYREAESSPHDIGVLSLRDLSLYLGSEGAEFGAVGRSQLAAIDRQMQEIGRALSREKGAVDRRPEAPPPASPEV